jgi:hypothetical protein
MFDGLVTLTVIVRLAKTAKGQQASNRKKIFLFMFVFVSLFTANFTQINENGGVYVLFFIFFRLKFGFKNIF